MAEAPTTAKTVKLQGRPHASYRGPDNVYRYTDHDHDAKGNAKLKAPYAREEDPEERPGVLEVPAEQADYFRKEHGLEDYKGD